MKDYLAGEASWRTAQEQEPPLGVKLLLLNPGGVCVVGTWDDWAVAWAPLPKVPAHIKHILSTYYWRKVHGYRCNAIKKSCNNG